MAKARKLRKRSLPHLTILEDISALISHSQDLQEALKSIAAIVAERMETEVCSLYIYDRQKNRLTLCATMGLDQESVGKVSMGINEGLTGLVMEKMSPVMVVDALAHPRYKYFPETGEERFHSFLGVPLIEKRNPLGVLVVQTSRRRGVCRGELRLRMSTLISKEEGALFDVHRMILEDPAIIEQIEGKIRKEGYVAEYAVSSVFEQHLNSFTQIEDEYLREKAADVKDAAQRLLENLSGIKEKTMNLPEEAILVAEDISPADLTLLEGDHFRGIALSTGGVTSHP